MQNKSDAHPAAIRVNSSHTQNGDKDIDGVIKRIKKRFTYSFSFSILLIYAEQFNETTFEYQTNVRFLLFLLLYLFKPSSTLYTFATAHDIEWTLDPTARMKWSDLHSY